MIKNSMLRKFGYMTLGSAVVIGTGAGAGFFIFNSKNKDDIDMINYKFRDVDVFAGEKNGVKIYEANDDSMDNLTYWMGDKGLEILKNRIVNELGYGPEFYQLKKIVIGDENFIGSGENGLYVPAVNSIYINLSSFKKGWNSEPLSYIISQLTEDQITEMKVNAVFEIIYHEYGHHLSQAYLQTNEYGAPYTDNKLNGGDKNGFNYWNKDFSDKFQEYLYYKNWNNDPTHQKYTDAAFLWRDSKNNQISYSSIGSLYSQEDLFKHANKDKDYKYPEIGSSKKSYMFGNKYSLLQVKLDESFLKYRYSIEELFTRKYQLLNQIFKPFNYAINDQSYLNMMYSSFLPGVTSELASNAILFDGTPVFGGIKKGKLVGRLDIKQLKDGLISKSIDSFLPTRNESLFTINSIEDMKIHPETSNRFLYDGVFNNEMYGLTDHSTDLYNLMDRHLGHADGDDISFIWNKNSINMRTSDSISFSDESPKNLIRFGGYVKDNSFSDIGYLDSNKFVSISKISTHDYTYKTKTSNTDQAHVALDTKLENRFYVTDDYINGDDIVNKDIYFYKEVKGSPTIVKLQNARGSNDKGFSRSYFPYQYNHIKNNIYQASVSNGVKIKKGKLYGIN